MRMTLKQIMHKLSNPNLTSIDFGEKDIGSVKGAQAIAKKLKHNTTLKEISLWSNYIGVDGAKAIAEVI